MKTRNNTSFSGLRLRNQSEGLGRIYECHSNGGLEQRIMNLQNISRKEMH